MHGLFLINKAAGYSSAQVIGKLRRRLGLDRIGHAGTLDPFATGLLVAACGRATRLIDYVQAGTKSYSGEILLGKITDSDDVTGAEISCSQKLPSFSEVQNVIPEFCGEISQTPPRISAVKIDGERAYARARKGQDFEISSRSVKIEEFSVSPGSDHSRIAFRVRCSKGTYIRSLARDIGERLGCGACLASLCREGSGNFSLDMAKSVDELSVNDMLAWHQALPEANNLIVDRQFAERLWSGDQAAVNEVTQEIPPQNSALLTYSYKLQDQSLKYCGVLRCVEGGWSLLANIGQPD